MATLKNTEVLVGSKVTFILFYVLNSHLILNFFLAHKS